MVEIKLKNQTLNILSLRTILTCNCTARVLCSGPQPLWLVVILRTLHLEPELLRKGVQAIRVCHNQNLITETLVVPL